jgi:RNA polymerase sigma factor (sigma-70 family)
MSIAPTDAERVPPDLQLDLWRRYRRTGDRRLRDRLIVIFAPLVHYVARHEADALPSGCDLDDLVSSGLEALILAIDRYDPAEGRTLEQYAWVRVLAAVRAELDHHGPPLPAEVLLAPGPADHGGDPQHLRARLEARRRFHEAFQALPERERSVAVMRYVDGLTLREIGQMLGVTESRVCQIESRLRRELRVTLADDEALLVEVA